MRGGGVRANYMVMGCQWGFTAPKTVVGVFPTPWGKREGGVAQEEGGRVFSTFVCYRIKILGYIMF